MKNTILLLALFVSLCSSTFAQKLGHINGQMLVEHMPEYKVALTELETYKKQFEDALSIMRQEYEQMIQEYQKAQGGNTPKVILEQKVKDIQAKEQGIYDFQEQASQDVQNEESKKLEPIVNKAKDAIEAVAKTHGYIYIFDAASGTMLYLGGEDVTKQVCDHLKIPDFTNEGKEGPKK
jgi:outer membrane protein